jgi:hypothetical protein
MKKSRTHIERIYVIQVEEPDDYYYKPEGVLFIDNQGHHTMYSADSRFNFLKLTVQKFPYADLENGVSFRDHNVKLLDVTDQYREQFYLVVEEIIQILKKIYESNPRQFFFLEKTFQTDGTNSHFVP